MKDAYNYVLKHLDPSTPVVAPGNYQELTMLLDAVVASQEFSGRMGIHDFEAYAYFASGKHPAVKCPPVLSATGNYARRWVSADSSLGTVRWEEEALR